MASKRSKKSMQLSGIVVIVLGAGLLLWARGHSPNMGFGEMMMMDANGYIIKQPLYNGILIIGGLAILSGVINLVRSFQAEGATGANSPAAQPAGLDRIKQAKELLDAGAIDAAEFEKIKKETLKS